jgi:hypothetical protein
MAIKTPTLPYAMNAATLTLGADDWTAAVVQAELQPQTGTVVTGIGGHKYRGKSTFQLVLGHLQDADIAGLTMYLFEHEGEVVAFTLVPVEDGISWEGNVVLAPTAIGGTGGTDLAQAAATLEVEGRPTPVAPAP